MLLFKIHVSVLVQALQGGWRNYTPFGHKKWRIKTRFFRWYDGEMMIAINCNWIQISIVSWIRDILVRIRIRRYVPLTYGSEFILGSGLRIRIRIQIPDPGVRKAPDPDLQYCFLNVLLLFFACWWKDPDPDVDPDPDLNKWWRIRIQEAQVKNTKILWCGSRSGCRSRSGSEQIMTYLRISGSVIFWSGSADLNHWLKDLDLF
jgi:hypothetical protein